MRMLETDYRLRGWQSVTTHSVAATIHYSRSTSSVVVTRLRLYACMYTPLYCQLHVQSPFFSHATLAYQNITIALPNRTWRMAIANRTCVSFSNQPKAPGTIAVNVTWMKRGFNACQTHRSMCPSIFNRLRAIARYWSEIATFSYPLHSTHSLGYSHWNSGKKFVLLVLRKLE